MPDSNQHMTPQERADAIRERVSHIARGCRAHTSHQPDVYLNDIDMYLRGFVEQYQAAREALERIAWSVGPDEYAPEDLLPQVRIAREALNPAKDSDA